ncbi:hypothetical protein KY290_021916 [Solanum tuberosum]|uniref:Uncharacterized protein n=1 Tax=Solanum tuberosum TaxID=4113 RepID=A0ABQ7V4Y0_SOLTU|nr:hypothetical protein KY289_021078 [Solanum tuberosum]KAH0758423.1 hypothetical protein KY290_021916 [Solanum tuberosum]
MFDEISHTTVSSEINVLNTIDHKGENFATTVAKVVDDNFSEDVNLSTAVLVHTKESNIEGRRIHEIMSFWCANEEKIQEVLQSNLTGCASEEKIQEVRNKDFFVPSLPIHQGSVTRLQIKSNAERKDSLVTSTLARTMVRYIGEFEYVDDHRSGKIVVELNRRLNKCGVISPRFDVGVKEIEE